MSPTRPTRPRAAYAGMGAAAITVAVGELLAGVWRRFDYASGTPSMLDAVGGAFIDRTPAWLKDAAIATFGTADKLILQLGVVAVLAALGSVLGLVAVRWPRWAMAGVAALGLLGGAAVLSRPRAAPTDLIPLLAGTTAGAALLWRWTHPTPGAVTQADALPGLSRRGLFVAGTGAVIATTLGRLSTGGARAVDAARAMFRLPPVAAPVTVPAGVEVGVRGVTPFIIPNADFYRIDTALTVPQIDPADWSLKVTGLVEREVVIDWQALLAKPMQEAMVTLMCVSNEVGDTLNGNAIWTGWPVRELLREAGVRPGADMVLSRSIDGFTAGTPLEALTDDRPALIAVAQNGQPLSPEHGFPVRLVVPGLYGYVSATKWVTELKVTRFADDEGYWTPRGWSALGPVKTQSRIDVPRAGARVAAGTVAIAGVAWAIHRGISRVQVRIDGAQWQDADLGVQATAEAWRQWVFSWTATPGPHTIAVRAIDASGEPQTDQRAAPAPDGATGHHTIRVTVE